MTPEELHKLEEEHKKGMEGINALNQALKGTINEAKDYIGIK